MIVGVLDMKFGSERKAPRRAGHGLGVKPVAIGSNLAFVIKFLP